MESYGLLIERLKSRDFIKIIILGIMYCRIAYTNPVLQYI